MKWMFATAAVALFVPKFLAFVAILVIGWFVLGFSAVFVSLGAIAGGPTFIGTLIGQSVTSEPVSVIFLTLAAGSILYVVIQLIGIGLKHRREILGWGILLGITAGFATDLIIDAAGA